MVRALEHSSYKSIICEVGAVLPNHTSCSPWSENFKMKIVKDWESVSFSKKKDKSFSGRGGIQAMIVCRVT